MNWKRSLLFLFVLILISVSFIFTFSKKSTVKLAGSTAFLPFAEKLAEYYMKKHPDVIIDVQGGGSALGIMASLSGIVDIGMVDMVTLPKETESLKKIVVAKDGIAVIVNPANQVSDLTLYQLKSIFNGE